MSTNEVKLFISFLLYHYSQGLQLARDLKDDYCVYSMAICKACALIFGGRLPYTLGEVKALRIEAVEASKRTKKYLSKIIRTLPQQHILDTVMVIPSSYLSSELESDMKSADHSNAQDILHRVP